MHEGWIMLHRKLLENPIVRKSKYCHLWVVLLLKASHSQTDFIWNNRRVYLQPGQFVTGRKKLSKETGIPESTVERILKYLESEQQIEQQTFNKNRIITIKNWKNYQAPGKIGQQADSRRTANGQQADTFNNDKNANNGNNREGASSKFVKPTAQEVTEYAKSMDFQLDGRRFVDFYESKGWMIGRNRMRDWKAAVRTWQKRENNGTNKNGRGFATSSEVGTKIEM